MLLILSEAESKDLRLLLHLPRRLKAGALSLAGDDREAIDWKVPFPGARSLRTDVNDVFEGDFSPIQP